MQNVASKISGLACALAIGCGGPQKAAVVDPMPVEQGPPPVRYAEDVQPVWDANCTMCHDGQTDPLHPLKDLDLSSGRSWAQLARPTRTCSGANTTVVVPGAPEQSPLWLRLNGGAACLDEMPPDSHGGLAVLDPTASELIHAWILQGAQND
jgi:hypothetical protein